ncbi:MAG: hypothetical protein ACKVVT_12780 [Dehalococcoidia bacterium]
MRRANGAASQGGGAEQRWETVTPLGLALALLMGVSLVLMRIRRRIDPS